jgi:polyphenol oxidase
MEITMMRHVLSVRRQARKAPATTIEDGWVVSRFSDLEILTAKIFEQVPWVIHGFSTRKGGASRLGGVAVFNLGFTDWDSPAAVAQNGKAFVETLAARKPAANREKKIVGDRSLITLRQIHSDVVHVFSEASVSAPQGDAAISRKSGLHLGIQTADCVPILMADARKRVVAAVHAGWRGTLVRIVSKTLGRMRLEFGTNPVDVIAAVGPSIGSCCYEVGPEVAQAFAGQFAKAGEWFQGPFERLATGEEPNPLPWLTMMPPGHEPPPERVRLDLAAANRWQLIDAGVNPRNIAVSSLCTGCRKDLFFSYRKEGAGTGRMLSVIGISARSR